MIGIRAVPDPDESFDIFESSLVIPLPGQDSNTIVFENRDGNNIVRLAARRLDLKRHGKTIVKTSNVDLSVFITDSRVALACSKYDKGGGWIGSGALAIPAVALNTGSMIRAARRRRGNMLVGQVRYPCLDTVKCVPRDGVLSTERLLLTAKADEVTTLELCLILPNDADSNSVACDIVRRAAGFRLRAEAELEFDAHTRLEEFSHLQPRPLEKGHFRRFTLPRPWIMAENAARLDAEAGHGNETNSGVPVGLREDASETVDDGVGVKSEDEESTAPPSIASPDRSGMPASESQEITEDRGEIEAGGFQVAGGDASLFQDVQ